MWSVAVSRTSELRPEVRGASGFGFAGGVAPGRHQRCDAGRKAATGRRGSHRAAGSRHDRAELRSRRCGAGGIAHADGAGRRWRPPAGGVRFAQCRRGGEPSWPARFTRAPKVRRLPKQVLPARLATLAAQQGRAASSMVWALSETERPVFFDGQHLLITGQPKCGRTTACATVMAEIGRRVCPGAGDGASAPAGRPAAQVWLVDPRRQLTNVLDPSYVHRFASTPTTVKQRMVELAGSLRPRMPDDELSVAQRRARGTGRARRSSW